jgi:hypothetical protein
MYINGMTMDESRVQSIESYHNPNKVKYTDKLKENINKINTKDSRTTFNGYDSQKSLEEINNMIHHPNATNPH